MIYSMDGNIVSIDSNICERIVNQLTFQIKGKYFPQSYYNFSNNNTNIVNGNESLHIYSKTPNTITVNYGDGTFAVKAFAQSGSVYRVSFIFNSQSIEVIPQKEYTDGFTGLRNITFTFQNPAEITAIDFSYLKLFGQTPVEVSEFFWIRRIKFLRTNYLDNISDKFPPLLDELVISATSQERKLKIPDSVFESRLRLFQADGVFNLTNITSSNFFKIGQLKKLEQLWLEDSMLTELPESLKECTLMKDLRLGKNSLTELPTMLNSFPNLRLLYAGGQTQEGKSLPLWDNIKSLNALYLNYRNMDFSEIPEKWKYLFSLSTITTVANFFGASMDFFIDNFYRLCTQNGSVVNSGSPAPYSNRFRNISWGVSSIGFTGAKVAPVGYIQGVSNGTPANQGQKVYVLQNQYNHVITHA